jgi:hypothetical protein
MWGDSQTVPDDEQARQTMARLLQARGEDVAAAVVAVSNYQDLCVDNWDGGQYESELAVPPEVYDLARSQCAEVLDRVCSDLVGAERYRGLNIILKRIDTNPDWVEEILAALKPRRVPSERVEVPKLPE